MINAHKLFAILLLALSGCSSSLDSYSPTSYQCEVICEGCVTCEQKCASKGRGKHSHDVDVGRN